MKKSKIAAAILMGGKGERFGAFIPKQFLSLSGRAVYLHTLDRFLSSRLFDEIIIVCPQQYIDKVRLETNGLAKVVAGGETRQESSYQAVLSCSNDIDYICIHDAVRPFVSKEILEDHIKMVQEHQAVDTCIKATDTMIRSIDGLQIKDIPNRSEYFRGQTPQTFTLSLIKEAHEKALQDGFVGTDDCSLVHRLSHPVYISYGSEENIKITTEIDLFIAEQLLRLKKSSFYSEQFSLTGKIFAITGGNGSIGSCIQKELETHGARVLNISRTSTLFPADLSHADSAKNVFERLHAEYGLLDGVINSVGQLVVKPLSEQTPMEIDDVIRSNLTSLIFSCKYAKVKEKGHILNIASSSYSKGRKDFVVYSSSKAAVVNFTQGFAEENPHLFINAIAPQRTLSEMRKKHFPNENTSTLLDPEYIAKEVIKILRSDQTGLIFDVKKNS